MVRWAIPTLRCKEMATARALGVTAKAATFAA
jgi:hypothetical protein